MDKLGAIGAGILAGALALSPCENGEEKEQAEKTQIAKKTEPIQDKTREELFRVFTDPGACPEEAFPLNRQFTCNIGASGNANGEIDAASLQSKATKEAVKRILHPNHPLFF